MSPSRAPLLAALIALICCAGDAPGPGAEAGPREAGGREGPVFGDARAGDADGIAAQPDGTAARPDGAAAQLDRATPRADGPPRPCTPACAGRACGDDGCGGSCGKCAAGTLCRGDDGKCVSDCVPKPEICNGKDDDCDGKIDETFTTLGQPCDGADTDKCKNGTFTCKPDGTGVQCVNEKITDVQEVCNGKDDDCDGQIDEGCVSSAAKGFVSIGGTRPQYEYGPSIVLVGAKYYAFYCSNAVTAGWDSIRMSSSTDGQNWSAPTVALAVYGGYGASAVCDPSVVRHNGVYLMYHTCINTTSAPDGYGNNRICVAAADQITGPWRPYDKPLVQDKSCTSDYTKAYCVGQPSALVHQGKVYLYYTKATPADTGPAPGKIFLSTSSDGVSFSAAAGGAAVWGRRNVDIKRERSTGLFFLVQGEVDTAHLPWSVSVDGIKWAPFDAARTLAVNPLPGGGTNHNPGLAGDAEGTFDGMTFVLYGSSYSSGWGNWHLYRTNLTWDPKANDCTKCVSPTCDQACSAVLGTQAYGTCKAPGSTSAGTCCGCSAAPKRADCSACAAGCVAACRGAGFQIGVCGAPGSTNPSACCSCF